MANNKFLEETGLSRLWSHVKKLVDNRATKIETRVTSLESQVNTNKLTAYPVGAIYMSVSSTSPASLFGGTWIQWAKDRVPIGVGSDSDFNTVEKTGGSKTYELRALIGAVGGNVHTIGYDSEPVVSGYGSYDMVIDASAGAKPQGASNTTRVVKSDGNPATTVQPYITCYMWKRVS